MLQFAFADPEWLIGDQVRSTGYLFAALVFWSLCFALSRYSARLDRTHGRPPGDGGQLNFKSAKSKFAISYSA